MNRSYYFKHSNEEGPLGGGFCFLEAQYIQTDLIVFRQLDVDGEKYIASNRITKHEQKFTVIDNPAQRNDKASTDWLPHPSICDQPIQEFAPSEEVPEITKEEFDFEWNRYLNTTINEWKLFKENNPLQKAVLGRSCVYYPQGVIININNLFFGIIDYKKYTAAFGNRLNIDVRTYVKGYDELNQWLLLDIEN